MERFKILKIIPCICFVLLTIIPGNEAFHLRAQQADFFLKTALKNNPMIKQKTYKEKAAQELYKKESILSKNPIFNIGYLNAPLTDWPAIDSHAMSGISIGISQYIAAPWEDTHRKEMFYKKYLSEKEDLIETKNLVAFQVQSLYHNILFLLNEKEILIKNENVLKNIMKIAESLVSVNKMNSSHLLKLKADIAVLSNKIIELQGKIYIEKSNMEKLCGIKLKWNITENSINNWIDTNKVRNIQDEFKVREHPLYKKIKTLYDTQKAAHNLEIAKLVPGATFGIEYRLRQEISGKEGDDFISFKAAASIPLYYAFKDRHAVNAEEKKENEFKEILKGIEIDLQTKWEGTRKKHEMQIKAFMNFEKDILPGYWSAYEAQIGALSSGTVTLLDVLDAYRLYLNASLESARLYKDLMTAKLQLYYLLHKYPLKK